MSRALPNITLRAEYVSAQFHLPSEGNAATTVGTDPVSSLLFNTKPSREERSPNSSGMPPLSLLKERPICCNLSNLPYVLGMVPVMSLLFRYRRRRSVSEAISEGSVPEKPFQLKSRYSTGFILPTSVDIDPTKC